jgi:hypothetical protein
MKKVLLIWILGLSLGLARCAGPDCGPFPRPKLVSMEADMTWNGEDAAMIRDPLASDLRLVLSLGVRYFTEIPRSMPSLFQTARACSPADPSGFDDEIVRLSLTCDKPIRGFYPGENILTTSADVYWLREGDDYKTPITLGQWLDMMNEGETTSLGGNYNQYYNWRDAYDVSIAFIPEGTPAVAGAYAFTLIVEMQSGTRYTETFAPVTLAAL